jgi:RNA-directed DNA polymerase
MQMNFYLKDGTAIISDPSFELKSNKNGHDVLETEHLWIHPFRHAVTGSNSRPGRYKKVKTIIYQIFTDTNILSNPSYQLDQLLNKRGNLGKTTLTRVEMLGVKTSLTYDGAKLRWVHHSQHGGKIMEKANAGSNSPYTRGTLKTVETNSGTIKMLPNSKYLNETPYKLFAHGRWIQDLPKGVRFISTGTSTDYHSLREAVDEKQRELMELARNKGKYDKTVLDKQLLFARSRIFRELAVTQISRKAGSQTPGVDREIYDKSDETMHSSLVEYLRETIYHPNKYRATAIKRAWIPKPGKTEKRLLGIPTLRDRTLQALINLVLLPLVELNSDPNSYGFRPHRDCKMAIAAVRIQLKTVDVSKPGVKTNALFKANHDKYILDADIKGLFDNINHEWLISNICLHSELKKILHQWLKAKILDKGTYADPLNGTPQGGIISPTLANFTLNGLEKTVNESIFPLTKSKEQRMKIKYADGTSTRLPIPTHVIRYADDFIVITRSKNILGKYIVPAIDSFLKERGLWLSPTKTKQYCLSQDGSQLDFLGYTFKYRTQWSSKKTMIYNKQEGKAAIALYPNRQKVIAHIQKLRSIFKESQNSSAMELISKLNPVIRGWSNYFNLDNSSRYRSIVREALYRLTWTWMIRKHPTLGKRNLAKLYLLIDQKDKEKTVDDNSPLIDSVNKNSKFKNYKWTFHGKSWTKSRYNKTKIERFAYLLNPINCAPITAAIIYLLPEKLRNVNAFDKEIKEVIDKRLKLTLEISPKTPTLKEKLFKIQKGKCWICDQLIDYEYLHYNTIHIHHINPIMKGGSKFALKNLAITHSWCHREHNHYE